MKYLWTEDTGAGLHFWKLVNQLFFDDALVVESKGSNINYIHFSCNSNIDRSGFIPQQIFNKNMNILDLNSACK